MRKDVSVMAQFVGKTKEFRSPSYWEVFVDEKPTGKHFRKYDRAMKAAEKYLTPYAILAYGSWSCFDTAEELRVFLLDWISGTEGAERDRAVTALMNFEDGNYVTNTDAA